jgi:hypothetical protein
MFLKKLISVSAMSLAIYGCGSDDDGGRGGGAADPDAVASAIANPSGEIADADGAQGVADAFADVLSNQAGTGGERRDGIDCSGASSANFSCECSGGGSLDVDSSNSTQESYEVTYSYNDCCISSGECCYDGGGWVAGTSSGSSDFNQCASFDGSIDCAGSSATFSYSYCLENGTLWYLVEYESESYAVSGYYDSSTGSGSWTVRDANGTWTCTASNNTGSCTNGTDTYKW